MNCNQWPVILAINDLWYFVQTCFLMSVQGMRVVWFHHKRSNLEVFRLMFTKRTENCVSTSDEFRSFFRRHWKISQPQISEANDENRYPSSRRCFIHLSNPYWSTPPASKKHLMSHSCSGTAFWKLFLAVLSMW